MNIDQSVKDSFAFLNLVPRKNQHEVCVKALESFLINGKKNVVIDASTGSGKSVIALVISHALYSINQSKSVLSTATNVLAKQYESDFKNRDYVNFVYGANNYECATKSIIQKKIIFANECYKKSKFFYQNEVDTINCLDCKFTNSRIAKSISPLIVTNYSYYILDLIYISKMMEPDQASQKTFVDRKLRIFDEAHLINETFTNHLTVHFSELRRLEYLKDLSYVCEDHPIVGTYANMFTIIMENINRGSIGKVNAYKFLDMLEKFYKKMKELCESKASWTKAEASYDYLKSLQAKYEGLFCKIDDIKKYEIEYSVDCDINQSALTIKPIFIKEMFQHLSGEYNLFLSGTINSSFLEDTLNLEKETIEYIKMDYAFNLSDKTIVINKNDLVKVNFESLKEQTTIDRISLLCDKYVKNHINESGIIVTTSFKLALEISEAMKTTSHNIMVHQQGTKLENIYHKFKQSNEPSILISPSLFEGLDFSGETSKFQIITKAPFYSLGDKRIKHIMKNYRKNYLEMCIMRLIQGLGRSTRFKGDKSVSYFLDKNITRLFNSKYNSWKDQFSVETQ